MAKQDTGKFRINTKDQFYTHPSIAKQCIDTVQRIIPTSTSYTWIEPSAGAGSFFHQFPTDVLRIGLDIEPKGEGILQQDFLTWTPPFDSKTSVVVVGNPPFGRQSSTAKAFLRKSCTFANVIAFILPKSFSKPSMYSVIPKHFHCLIQEDLPENAFVLDGTAYDVPCIFQIWQKKETERPTVVKQEPKGFTYVRVTEGYHIAFRRVGVYAGKATLCNGSTFSPQSHYFLCLDEQYRGKQEDIVRELNAHVFPSNTVGPRSLSKPEVNCVLNRIIDSHTPPL